MTTPIAQPAVGTAIAYSTDSGVTWITIGEVTSINGVGGNELGVRDTTVLSSARHTGAPTIPTPQDIEISFYSDPTDTGHQQLRNWSVTPATADPQWRVTFPFTGPPSKYTWTGFVKNYDGINAGDVDGNLEATVTIQRNSAVTES